MIRAKVKNRKQWVILFGAMVADFVWLYIPGSLFIIFVAPYGSVNGALGEGTGVVLSIAIAVLLTRLWSPFAWKLSEPLIKKLIKRIGANPEEE